MINHDQVLYADRYGLYQGHNKSKNEKLLIAFNNLFFTTFKFPQKRCAERIFFRSLVRNDYKKLFHEIASAAPSETSIVIEDYLRKTTKIAPMAIFLIIKLLPLFFSFKATNLYERVFLYIRLCFYYRIVAAVSKYNFNTLILFADMQPVECLLAQYFRSRGKKTVTLQHGLYADYGDYPTVNIINYLHQPSEYFLAWGRHTADLIYRTGTGRKVVICGKPSVAISSHIKPKHTAEHTYFSVILDQNIFEQHNIDMLKLACQYAKKASLKINIRYHPGNNRRTYQDLARGHYVDLDLDGSLFVIGHTSSMLHEMMLLGVPAFKYASDAPSVEMPDELIFTTSEQLNKLATNMNSIDFNTLAKDYISFFGQSSLERYSNFFLKLENNENIITD